MQKPGLINQYSALGFPNPVNVSLLAGIFEVMAAIAILVKPARPLIIFLLIWKMGTELFYPHFEILEWAERGGSCCCFAVSFADPNLQNKKII